MPALRTRSRPDAAKLAAPLDALRRDWEGRRLDSDPLAFPHCYADAADQELVAFLAASLAFGRVASIRASLERLLDAIGPSPRAFLAGWDGGRIASLDGFVHRWVGETELRAFLRAVRGALAERGSLGALFLAGDRGEADFVPALARFYAALRDKAGAPRGVRTRGLRFLLPDPEAGGACKRAHLFLRWMVRKDAFDLGLWRDLSPRLAPARLLLPMDTHVHRISTYLGLTARPTADLRAAREATDVLRALEPDDPVSYDWALSRLGILAECVRDFARRRCERCPVRSVCRAARRPTRAMPHAVAA